MRPFRIAKWFSGWIGLCFFLCGFAGTYQHYRPELDSNPASYKITQISGQSTPTTENDLSRIIVDAAFKIHTTLGPGLYESVYEATMAHELNRRACTVVQQRGVPVLYEDVRLNLGFRADIIVDKKVIIEVKSIESLAPVHAKQLRTYLRLTDLRLGLLINFNVDLIKNGIRHVVNNL